MAEYINKKAMLEQIARRELQMTGDKRISIDALREFIKNRPVIEIRHGHWVCKGDGSYGNNQLYCSVCKKVQWHKRTYHGSGEAILPELRRDT